MNILVGRTRIPAGVAAKVVGVEEERTRSREALAANWRRDARRR